MKTYSGLTAKELRNFFVQNISEYDCIEQMLTDTYGKKGFCVAFGVEWESYDEAMQVLTKYTSERPERVPKHYIINKFQNKGIFECVQHCESGETLLTGSFIGGAKVYTFIKTEFDLERANER